MARNILASLFAFQRKVAVENSNRMATKAIIAAATEMLSSNSMFTPMSIFRSWRMKILKTRPAMILKTELSFGWDCLEIFRKALEKSIELKTVNEAVTTEREAPKA